MHTSILFNITAITTTSTLQFSYCRHLIDSHGKLSNKVNIFTLETEDKNYNNNLRFVNKDKVVRIKCTIRR